MILLSMNFVTQTYVVVSVRMALAMGTGCAQGLATGNIFVGLRMFSVRVG